MDDQSSGHETSKRLTLGAGIAIGTSIGVALGASFDNMGFGIGIGLAIGIAISAAPEFVGRRRRGDAPGASGPGAADPGDPDGSGDEPDTPGDDRRP